MTIIATKNNLAVLKGTITRVFLSESSNGRPIKVVTTTTPGTLIHTAHVSDIDEVYIQANNTSEEIVKLTVEFGGTTSPDDSIIADIDPYEACYLVIPGLQITNGLNIRAFAETANVINVVGFVNRIGS